MTNQVILALIVLSLCSSVGAQTLEDHWTRNGLAADDILGRSLARVPDLNGDGVSELLVGAYEADSGGTNRGAAYLLDGQHGTLMLGLDGFADGDLLGHGVAAVGDADGDGQFDLAVGAPGADVFGMDNRGKVFVFSSNTGVLLYTLNGEGPGDSFGYILASAGVNHEDLLVGARFHDFGGFANRGKAYLLDGATGATVFTWLGPSAGGEFGSCVAGLGDINGDGVPDLGVGAHRTVTVPGVAAGRVFLFSGATGAAIGSPLNGVANNDNFGWAITGLGDQNGDLVPDFAVGAYLADGPAGMDAGKVYLYSGADRSLLRTLDGDAGTSHFGWALCDGGDLDGDALSELIVGSPKFSMARGLVAIFRTGTSTPWVTRTGSLIGDNLGISLAGLGDVDGDGFGDVAAGSLYFDLPGAMDVGQVVVFGIETGLFVDLGHAKAGSSGMASLSGEGTLIGGLPGLLRVEALPPGQMPILVLSIFRVDLPIFDGTLVPAPDLLMNGDVADVTGTTTFGFTWPVALAGVTLFSQVWFVDPLVSFGVAATNGLSLTGA